MALAQLLDQSMIRLKEALRGRDGPNGLPFDSTERLTLLQLREDLVDANARYTKQLADPTLRQRHPRIRHLQARITLANVEEEVRKNCQKVDDHFVALQLAEEAERPFADAERHDAADMARQHLHLPRVEEHRARDLDEHQVSGVEQHRAADEQKCPTCEEPLHGACER